jgi:hypothetical protein
MVPGMNEHVPGRPLVAIAVGGGLAATLHWVYVGLRFTWRAPLAIAGGLVGPEIAKTGGAGIYMLGLLLHYGIAAVAAAIYFGASRRLRFLVEHWLLCGLLYGIPVFLVMHFIVLPLSALHDTGPYPLSDLLQGLVEHMILIGLPIAYSVRRYAP